MNDLPKAFSADVMAELARPAEIYGARNCEMKAGLAPAWYVVETYAQCERKVADELITRRFGIFVPEIEETIVRRGRKVDRKALMFTRYIFVFTWLTDRNYSLITSIEGVFRFVSVNDGIPVIVKHADIDVLRMVENGQRPFTVIFDEDGPPEYLSKKARRRWKPKPRVFNPKTDIVCVRAWSAFDDGFAALDSEVRNQTLRKALGLAPSTCP